MRSALPLAAIVTFVAAACSSSDSTTGGANGPSIGDAGGDGSIDASADVPSDAASDAPSDAASDAPPPGGIANPCNLPGSVQFTAAGMTVKPGGDPSWPDLTFLKLPAGFCAHYYGRVGNPRQVRFAPGGELFVASPTGSTTGGGGGGLAAIVVLPDDDLDGVADVPDGGDPIVFLAGLPYTQGLMFAPGYLYYQDNNPSDSKGRVGTLINRMPYTAGQRNASPPAMRQTVANITYHSDALHWPKPIDVADDGSIYVGNGGAQGDQCQEPHPFWGGIRKIDPSGANLDGLAVAQGFRNPIALRCQKGKNKCFALELGLDYSYNVGGREKMVPIRQGDDWGFPCCAAKSVPYPASPDGTDCSGVAAETNSFVVGDTPFGLDFEGGFWPAPYNHNAFVALHGAAGNWAGERVVMIPMDPNTGMPLPTTDIADGGGNQDGPNVGMTDFATGFQTLVDGKAQQFGRPAAVTFGPDGRLFIANDTNGIIFWIAPM
jgi:glucose/arabinose dehydrogenase